LFLPFNKGFEHIMKDLDAPIIPVNIDRIWGSIFSYVIPTDTYTDLYDFGDTANDGSTPKLGSFIVPGTDVLYGSTTAGGQNGVGVLYSYDISDDTYTILDQATTDDSGSANRLFYDASTDIIYGTSYSSGTNTFGTIFSYSSGGGGAATPEPATMISGLLGFLAYGFKKKFKLKPAAP